MSRGVPGWQTRLPSGRWRVGIRIRGQQIRRTVDTESEAIEWRVEMARRREELAPIQGGSVTYREIAPILRSRWRAPGRHTDRVIRGYESQLDLLLEWWGPRRIAHTRPRHVVEWEAHLRDQGRAPSTIRHYLDRLAQLHDVAVDEGFLASVPCPVRRPPLVQRTVRRDLPDEDLAAVLVEAGRDFDLRVPAILLLAADAGLARQEIARLRSEDVEIDEHRPGLYGYVHVRVRGHDDRPKSDRGLSEGGRARVVPILTERLRDALAAMPAREGLLLGLRSSDGVSTLASRPWRAALGRDAELHRLRHRWITRMLANPAVSPEQVRRWAGHRLLRTTQGYSHVDPRDVPEGADDTLRDAARRRVTPRNAPRRGARD